MIRLLHFKLLGIAIKSDEYVLPWLLEWHGKKQYYCHMQLGDNQKVVWAKF
jgi:hypothetical protein